MKILAIETSCDESGIAIMEMKNEKISVLSHQLASQVDIHQEYGGVYPTLAIREHQKNLIPLLKEALKESNLNSSNFKYEQDTVDTILEREPELQKQFNEFLSKNSKPDIDAIAIDIGLGLEPCLWVGVNLARALSYVWGLPIIPVSHTESHILVNALEHELKDVFPAISLVVSGGHTQLIHIEEIGKYKIIGETRDDAAGECFDKTARTLGLSYPGGPAIQKEAEKAQTCIELPSPMINTPDYNFSFSGLKTALLYKYKEEKNVPALACGVQAAIVNVLVKKTLNAVLEYQPKSVIVGGGVSANTELRKQLKEKIGSKTKLLIPSLKMATDNGIMIGAAALLRPELTTDWRSVQADANLRIDNS